jgi:predicted RNase H-like nuclease (RuvC/YqgF family)
VAGSTLLYYRAKNYAEVLRLYPAPAHYAMVADMDATIDGYVMQDLQHSLRNTTLELELARSKHSVEAVAKDEEIRKLRVSQCLLQDDNGDLHEQLDEEQARSDELENALEEALAQLDEQTAADEAAQNQLHTKARENANLKVGALVQRGVAICSHSLG